MLIRRAENKDADGINSLLYQVQTVHQKGRPDLFREGAKKYTDDEVEEIINDEKTPVFVCVDEKDKVLGYAFCIFQQCIGSNSLMDIKTLYIDDLCVDENERGKHIGSSLYEYVVNFAKESGCYNLTLNVWELNEGAKKFYEACGLKPQKISMEKIL